MAIQPIDLQTLFTQLDKVAKVQNALRDGAATQQALQGAELQRKMEAHVKTVNETQNTGDDGTEKVKDKGSQAHDGGKGKKQKGKAPPAEEEKKAATFDDPRLGKNVDISF